MMNTKQEAQLPHR